MSEPTITIGVSFRRHEWEELTEVVDTTEVPFFVHDLVLMMLRSGTHRCISIVGNALP